MKAVREALDKVSLPTLLVDVPGGVEECLCQGQDRGAQACESPGTQHLCERQSLRPPCPREGSCFDLCIAHWQYVT